MEEKKLTTWQIVNLEIKMQVKVVKAVMYNIDRRIANCSVLTMMEYVPYTVHCWRNTRNWRTAIYRQIFKLMLIVEHFLWEYYWSQSIYIFSKHHDRNLVWNSYGSIEDRLPFHSWNLLFNSIQASSIFHTKISIPYHTMPCL